MAWVVEKTISSSNLESATLGNILNENKIRVVCENVTWDGSTGYVFSQAAPLESDREFGIFGLVNNIEIILGGLRTTISPSPSITITNETLDLTVDITNSTALLVVGGVTIFNSGINKGTGRVDGQLFRFFAREGGFNVPNGTRIGNTSVYINDVLVRYYDATASDHSGSTDQPILVDTVGSNNATGVGFPSFDASVWVNLGGGGEELIIDSGSFTISGTTQPLKSSFNTITESGNYALTGTASGLIYNGSIVNESGTYTLIGADADLKSVFNIISESGQYNLTGTEVTLIYSPGSGEIITIDSGAFQLLGTEQNLKYNAKLIVNPGDYSLSGTQTQIKYNGNVPLDSGSYLYNGSSINLVADYGIITGIGNYSLLGSVVSLVYSGDTNQKIGVVTVGFKENTISTNYKPNSITVNFKGS